MTNTIENMQREANLNQFLMDFTTDNTCFKIYRLPADDDDTEADIAIVPNIALWNGGLFGADACYINIYPADDADVWNGTGTYSFSCRLANETGGAQKYRDLTLFEASHVLKAIEHYTAFEAVVDLT